MSQPVEVIVTVHDSHANRLTEITNRLKKEGLQVGQVLEFTGQVFGRCASSKVDSLCNVEGVAAVERSREISLPPPDADVQ